MVLEQHFGPNVKILKAFCFRCLPLGPWDRVADPSKLTESQRQLNMVTHQFTEPHICDVVENKGWNYTTKGAASGFEDLDRCVGLCWIAGDSIKAAIAALATPT